MTTTSQPSVARVTSSLNETEGTLEDLLMQQAELFSTIVQAGLDLSVPAALTQPVLLRLAKAQNSLLEVRSDLVRSHSQLLKIGEERADILTGPCPSASASRSPHLAAVA